MLIKNQEKKYNVDEIIVSGANEKGEGEHKILDYIKHVAGDGEAKGLFEKLGIDIEDNTEKTRNYELIRSTYKYACRDNSQLFRTLFR